MSNGPDRPARRRNHTSEWTGTEVIVWGGVSQGFAVATGGLYCVPSPPTGSGRASGLIVHKVGLGVTIQWAPDSGCVDEDTYAIYEGALGDFTSHLPIACDTAPSHSWNFTPGAGNRYFLVVPVSGNYEGSYGLRSNGIERTVSAAACAPQLLACP